jgi:hypothetical protein
MKNFTFVSIILATIILATGYTLAGWWPGAALSVALGLLWLVSDRSRWRGWPQMTTLSAAAFIGAAATGAWLGVSPGWLLAGLTATLAAWDAADLAHRLGQAGRVEGETKLAQTHLTRLLTVIGLSLALGGVALSLQLKLNLGWGIAWGLLAVFGLSRVIGQLRRESD